MKKRKKSGLEILGLGKQRQDQVVSKGVADSCGSLIPACSSASSRRPAVRRNHVNSSDQWNERGDDGKGGRYPVWEACKHSHHLENSCPVEPPTLQGAVM